MATQELHGIDGSREVSPSLGKPGTGDSERDQIRIPIKAPSIDVASAGVVQRLQSIAQLTPSTFVSHARAAEGLIAVNDNGGKVCGRLRWRCCCTGTIGL